MLNIITKNNSVLENKKSNNKLLYTIATLVALTISSGSNEVHARNRGTIPLPLPLSSLSELINNQPKLVTKVENKFNEEEDNIIRNGAENGLSWEKIAGELKNKTVAQVRSRWFYYLSPYKDEKWTKEEDETIIRQVDSLGTNWRAISAFLPGRNVNSIKNRYNTHLRAPSEKDLKMLARFKYDVVKKTREFKISFGLDDIAFRDIYESLDLQKIRSILEDRKNK